MALETALTDQPSPDDADTAVSSTHTDTEKPKRKAPRTAFSAGYDPRRNLAGRPKKGESLPELLKRSIERPHIKAAVVSATVERLMRTDAVGNRAFADVRDTVYGIPKQTLVLEQGDSPLLALFQQFNAIDAGTPELPAPDEHPSNE